ncbi:hypothetical protein [Actinomadura decatromicini]|uniref:hypothetical protein n=1 Tax=Actinomadura decatromicini TaxID=2604572 RepID=UPI001CA30FAB|nr:hypothetical protein [Actinomadura decatromicini]
MLQQPPVRFMDEFATPLPEHPNPLGAIVGAVMREYLGGQGAFQFAVREVER